MIQCRFVPGQRLQYGLDTSITQNIWDESLLLGTQRASWKTHVTQRVLEIEADGSAHILQTISPVSHSSGLEAVGITLERQVTYFQVDSRGRILESVGPDPLVRWAFPGDPVEAGQSWQTDSETSFPFLSFSARYTTVHTLEVVETLDGCRCARIAMRCQATEIEAPLPDAKGPASMLLESEGTLWFALEEGMAVRFEMKTRAIPTIKGLSYETLTVTTQELLKQPESSDSHGGVQ